MNCSILYYHPLPQRSVLLNIDIAGPADLLAHHYCTRHVSGMFIYVALSFLAISPVRNWKHFVPEVMSQNIGKFFSISNVRFHLSVQ